jgi:hypothetical protein
LAQISGLKKNNKNGQPPTVKNVTPLRMCKGVPPPSWIKRNTSTKDKKKKTRLMQGGNQDQIMKRKQNKRN